MPEQAEYKAPIANLGTLTAALREGSLSLMAYIDELEAYFSSREPQVQAFVPESDRFERLRQEARRLLEQYPDPETRPPLFGVPLGVKDIFHVRGFDTTAGSKLPVDALQGPEAAVVTVLKKAGALVLGKTVTTEFAYFAPGPTRNPHHPEHTPGGSSSGSAAAVGAGLCPLALGTQTIGSVNRPAAFCGVVGYKPSYERISREGVIPLSPSLDHVGLFTADVAGMRLAAGLVVERWQPEARPARPVLAIPRGPYLEKASAEGIVHFRAVVERLISAGFRVKTVRAMSDFEQIAARHQELLAAEAAEVHAEWFAQYDHLYHAKTAELLTRGEMVPQVVVDAARAGRQQLRQALMDLMDEHDVDFWIAPAAPGAAPGGLESTGDPIMNLPWTQSGLPAVSVPAGYNEDGLPLGLQLVGRWHEDEALLQGALAIEAVLRQGGT
ncbi:MAG: amidase [Chloroflexota bacterium]